MTDYTAEKAFEEAPHLLLLLVRLYKRAVVALGFVVASRIRKARTVAQKQALHIEDFKRFARLCGERTADRREITGSRARERSSD